MKATAILSSDVLDILFENRNKDYGAYLLRKEYNARLLRAMIFMAALVSIICYFFMSYENVTSNPVIPILTILEKAPSNEIKKKETPKPKVAKAAVATFKEELTPKIVADSKADTAKNVEIITGALPSDNNEKGEIPGPEDVVPGEKNGGGGIKEIVEPIIKKVIDKTIPISNPDIEPSFPGGVSAFIKFLERNLRSPEDLEAGTEIAVRVKFVVNYDGTLKGFEIVQTGGRAFDEEVLRVLKKMPEWIPGKSSGETVSVFFTVPVRFRSQENEF